MPIAFSGLFVYPLEGNSNKEIGAGSVLLSHEITLVVSSALGGLTTVFGMGTSVSLLL